jgi:hypothetical protein
MPIIIPTAASTFGDSTTTEGGALRKYVLAQFRSDADFEWVKEVRAALVKEELKYRDLKAARPRLRENRNLWARIDRGVAQASIIVIDPEPVQWAILEALRSKELDPAVIPDEKALTEQCATAIVAGTPVAYLPLNLAQAVPWGLYDPIGTLDKFTPDAIRAKIGGGLKQAMVFAARAHATFDLVGAGDKAAATDDVFKSPLARVMFAELLATSRAFDNESPPTLPVLNAAAGEIAQAVAYNLPDELVRRASTLVREVDSRGIDDIQAADIAAGWARDMLETGEPKDLGGRFERVWINGYRLK